MQENAREAIRTVTNLLSAVERGDRAAILSHHAPELLMFDLPAEVEGLREYDATWDFFFREQRGPIQFTPSDLRATAGEDVAFVTCRVHCEGTRAGPLDFRLTVGLKKTNDEWTIVHEHHSLRTTDDRYVDSSEKPSARINA